MLKMVSSYARRHKTFSLTIILIVIASYTGVILYFAKTYYNVSFFIEILLQILIAIISVLVFGYSLRWLNKKE